MTSCSRTIGNAFSAEKDKEMVLSVLENLDDHTLDMDTKMSVYSEDVVHMAQGSAPITTLSDLRNQFIEEAKWGHSEMKHEAYEIHSYADHVIVRGGVTGVWHSKDGKTQMPFKTNNLITLKREQNGTLKIWHVIFNRIES